MPDDNVLENVKRAQEIADRPGKTAPIPVPPELKAAPAPPADHQFSKVPYSAAAPKKGEAASIEWNKQQQKVAEDATK